MKRTATKSPERKSKWLPGIAEFEEHKGRRADISHARAVRESEELRQLFLRMWARKARPRVALSAVLNALEVRGIPFVLIGAHAFGSYTGRPRATKDIDILVRAGRDRKRAVDAIQEAYPILEKRTFGEITEFFRPREKMPVIDVIDTSAAEHEETFRTARWVNRGRRRFRVQTVEAALAQKYRLMRASTLGAVERLFHAVDFGWMVKHSDDPAQAPIDLTKLKDLAEMVSPKKGGEDILRLVEQLRTDRIQHLAEVLRHRSPARSSGRLRQREGKGKATDRFRNVISTPI